MTEANSQITRKKPGAAKKAAVSRRKVVSRKGLISCLGHGVRWSLLEELSKGAPMLVVELAGALRLPRSVVSKHLKCLLTAGLVVRGRAAMYSIPGEALRAGEEASGGRVVDFGAVVLRFGGGIAD